MTANSCSKLPDGLKTNPEKYRAKCAMIVKDSASKEGSKSTIAKEKVGSTVLRTVCGVCLVV
jgi:hypothetical protein